MWHPRTAVLEGQRPQRGQQERRDGEPVQLRVPLRVRSGFDHLGDTLTERDEDEEAQPLAQVLGL